MNRMEKFRRFGALFGLMAGLAAPRASVGQEPVVDTGLGVLPIGRVTATLNGELTAGVSAGIEFWWGTNPGNWSHTNHIGTVSEGPFRLMLDGLTPGDGYAYMIQATNAGGAGLSSVVAFTTITHQAWFGGGAYDGYEDSKALGGMNMPQVNNAGGATNITSTNAWLNGMLLSTGGAPAAVYVFWGQEDGLTNRGAWAHGTNFGFVAERVALTTNVTLTPNSSYYYRYYATNAIGEKGWADASAMFAVPGPPSVNAGPGALPLGRTTATLNGELTAGNSAAVTIYWGTDSGDWGHTNSFGSLPEGPFRLMLDKLTPSTEYFYRIEAVNDYGTAATAVDVPFTTIADTAWFGGGSYDGYDTVSGWCELQFQGGTFLLFR